MILALVPDQIAAVVHYDPFAVDHTCARRQRSDRFDNERETIREIEAVAGVQHAIAGAVGDDAKSVVAKLREFS